jgi:NADH-quinone oxidoreductase subunit J
MDIRSALFYIFASVLLFSAFRVITVRNTVHASLYLVLAFFQASGLWMLLEAEFLSITLVLVYVGAVMVLFLFVVMMLDVSVDAIRIGFWKHFPLAATLGAVVSLELAGVLMGGFRVGVARPMILPEGLPAPQGLEGLTNTKALGILLYSNYLFPVEIAAVILLVAIVAAIALTLRKRKDSKYQDPGEQIRVKSADRLHIVKMAAVVDLPSLPEEAPTPSGDANALAGEKPKS